MRVRASRIGEDFDVDQKGAHAGSRVDALGASGAQSRGGDVGSVPLPVVGVNRSVGIGGCGGGIEASHPLLVVVTRGVAVRLVVDVVKVVERPVFVVHAGVKHGDDHALAGVAALVGAG